MRRRLLAFLTIATLLLAGAAAGLMRLAHATVTTSASTITLAGNGSQTAFTFPFVGVAASDIQVIFTDASGNQQTLTQGPGPTQYGVSLNAAIPPALWGVGGTVTYAPSGTPIASGTTLTISRVLPLTQTTVLQNQASYGQYAAVAEQAIDQAIMALQQVAGTNSRAIVGNIANSAPPLPLPPAAQAANKGLCFDGTGNNIIACSLAPAGVISSAMAPVVGAATLATGRTAFGLGTMSTEGIGAGLQDDGAGNARVSLSPAADASNQAVIAGFHLTRRVAGAAIIYTLPRGNTLFSGFGFWVTMGGNTVTFAIDPADSFNGAASGASFAIPPGVTVFVNTNATTNATWWTTGINPATPNYQLNASVSSNALTVSLKDRNGNDPSANSPVTMSFRDPTLTGGDPVMRAVTGALSIVVPSTATIGTVNGQANRLWVGWMDNAGTPALCVYNSLSGTSILPWDETSPANGTSIAGGSNSAQTWYCNGSVTSKALRILGYVESTQATAGTWATSPTKIALFGPGVKRPGDTVQELYNKLTGSPTTTSATFVALTSQNAAISPQAAANLIRIEGMGSVGIGQSGVNQSIDAKISLSRGTTANTNLLGNPSISHLDEAGAGATIGTNIQYLSLHMTCPTQCHLRLTRYKLLIVLV